MPAKSTSSTKKSARKLIWINANMNPELVKLKSYYDVVDKKPVLKSLTPSERKEFDIWFAAKLYSPLKKLITYQVAAIESSLSDDDDISDEIFTFVYDSIIVSWDVARCTNSFGYLTRITRNTLFDILQYRKPKRFFSALHHHKFNVYSVEPMLPNTKLHINERVLEGGDTYRTCSLKPIASAIDEDPSFDVPIINDPNFVDLVKPSEIAKFLPRCIGNRRHKKIAHLILGVLEEILQDKETIPTGKYLNYLFIQKLLQVDSTIYMTREDIELVRNLCQQAWNLYAETNIDYQPIYGQATVRGNLYDCE